MEAPAPAGEGFVPPPYPYARLQALSDVAERCTGGVVDLSVGTPGDPPPPQVLSALATSGTERGYPSSPGSPAFREAAAGYLGRRFGIDVDAGQVAACVGTKELVASLSWYLRLRSPQRDTVIGPALAYPTYAMGATLAGCRYLGVHTGADGVLDLAAVSSRDAARALVLWVNSPANPSGQVHDLAALVSWGRAHGVAVCSDECYAEFTWDRPAASALQEGTEGVLVLHSLSKRSNLAGVRAGFYAGDPVLVRYLAEVRTHAGLMVPGPVQAAAVVALGDDEHVEGQRQRYRRRLGSAVEALSTAGMEATMPAGGFYLWVPVPAWAAELAARSDGEAGPTPVAAGGDDGAAGRSGAWVLAEALARGAGILVSPGEFYGEDGAGFVRMALVVPDERLGPALDRLVDVACDLPALAAEGWRRTTQAVPGGGQPDR